MFKTDSNIFVKLVLLVLLAVTGYMTWTSLTAVMGGGMAVVIAALALVAFEGGIIMGSSMYNNAATERQGQYAILLVIVSWVGISMGAIMEVMMFNQESANVLEYIRPVLPFAVIAIILINVALYKAYEMDDPEARLRRAERRAEHAEMLAEVHFREQKAQAMMRAAQKAAPDTASEYAESQMDVLKKRHGANGASTGTGGGDTAGPLPDSGTPTRRGKSTQPPAR